MAKKTAEQEIVEFENGAYIGVKVTTEGEVSVLYESVADCVTKNAVEHVNGYIELISPMYCGLPDGWVMVVDEEGAIRQKKINLVASAFYGLHVHGIPIVGDVVFMKQVRNKYGSDLEKCTNEEAMEIKSIVLAVRNGIYDVSKKN